MVEEMLSPIITVNDRGESKCQGYGYFCLTLVVHRAL